MFMRRLLLCPLSFCALATPVLGQNRNDDYEAVPEQYPQQQRREDDTSPGRVAESAVGRAGQRQTTDDVVPDQRLSRRVSNRIENRVQLRIDNRIDEDYNPQADAKSPFAAAEEKATHSAR